MANININLKGFDPNVYKAWKNGAFSWHGGIKNGNPFIKNGDIEIILENDKQLKIKL